MVRFKAQSLIRSWGEEYAGLVGLEKFAEAAVDLSDRERREVDSVRQVRAACPCSCGVPLFTPGL